MKRALFTDIDGTLIFKEKTENSVQIPDEPRFISEKTIELLAQLLKNDWAVVLVTGRRPTSYDRLSGIIPHSNAIVEHGSIILDKQEIDQEYYQNLRTVIHRDDSAEQGSLWEFRDKLKNMGYGIYDKDRLATFRVTEFNSESLDGFQTKQLTQLIEREGEQYSVKYTLNEGRVDILADQADKRHAINYFLNEYNITLKDCVAVGNDINDLEMLDMDLKAACPSDSHKEVIGSVKIKDNGYVSEYPGHQGIIDILENFVLKLNG